MARGWGYLYLSGLSLYYAHGRWYNPNTALWLSPDEKGEYVYGSGQDAVNKVFLFALGAFCQFRSDMGAGVTESLDLTFTKITGQPSFNEQSCKPNQNETSYQIGSAVTHAGTYSLSGIEIGGGLTLFFGGGTVEVGSLGTATPVAVPMSGIGMGMMAHGGGMLINNLRGDIGKIISSFKGGSGRSFNDVLSEDETFMRWLKHKHPADQPRTLQQARDVWNKLQAMGFNPRFELTSEIGDFWKGPHINVQVGGTNVHIPVEPGFSP